MKIFKSHWAFYFLILSFLIIVDFASCIEEQKVVRLEEVDSLGYLGTLADARQVEISNPGRGWRNLVVSADKNRLLTGEEPLYDIVLVGQMNTAKEMWIKNFAADSFSVLLSGGNSFRVKRSGGGSQPVVTITMAGKGVSYGARAEITSQSRPPYTVARINLLDAAIPNFKVGSAAKSFYLRGTYDFYLRSEKDVEQAEYRTPTDRLLKLLFEIEYPNGEAGALSGRIYLLNYTAGSVSSDSLSMDCLYYITID